MSIAIHSSNRRRRRHRSSADSAIDHAIDHADRRALERDGWRTLLDYRENHVRAQDGTLVAVLPQWTGEAELAGAATSRPVVATATAESPDEVWRCLRREVAALHARL
jgi:hypothetical protein